MNQLILHLVGDYITQSDWMVIGKIKNSWIAIIHVVIYSLPFKLIGSWRSISLICISHFFIDRFQLAKYLVFIKNHLGWPFPKWEDCKKTGYSSERPIWLVIWLLIIADNTLHLICNYLFLRYL